MLFKFQYNDFKTFIGRKRWFSHQFLTNFIAIRVEVFCNLTQKSDILTFFRSSYEDGKLVASTNVLICIHIFLSIAHNRIKNKNCEKAGTDAEISTSIKFRTRSFYNFHAPPNLRFQWGICALRTKSAHRIEEFRDPKWIKKTHFSLIYMLELGCLF